MLGAIEYCAVAQGQRVRDTHVDPHGRTTVSFWLRLWQLYLQTNIPTRRLAQEDNVLQLAIGHSPMPAHSDKPGVLHIQLTPSDTGPVARFVVDAIKAVRLLKSRIATLTLEELPEGAVKAAQDLLTGRHVQHAKRVDIRFLVAPVAPHRRLLIVRDAMTRFLPSLAPEVQRRVVQPASGLKDIAQGLRLFWCGVEAILVRTQHLAPLLHLYVFLDCFCRNITGRANIVATSPQARKAALKPRDFLSQNMRSVTFNTVHALVGRNRWWEATEKVNVVRLNCQVDHVPLKLCRLFVNKLLEPFCDIFPKYRSPVLGTPNKVVVDVVGCVPRSFTVHKLIIAQLFGNTQQQGNRASARLAFPSPLKEGVPCGSFYGNSAHLLEVSGG